jgi:hypothetical protein
MKYIMSLSIEDIMYKYKLFWQFPVITEKSFYDQYKNSRNFLGFPWATIIDRKLKIEFIFDILKSIVDLNKQYFTCCQHILYKRMVPLFKLLNITTIYACHKTKTVNCINVILVYLKKGFYYSPSEFLHDNIFLLQIQYDHFYQDNKVMRILISFESYMSSSVIFVIMVGLVDLFKYVTELITGLIVFLSFLIKSKSSKSVCIFTELFSIL